MIEMDEKAKFKLRPSLQPSCHTPLGTFWSELLRLVVVAVVVHIPGHPSPLSSLFTPATFYTPLYGALIPYHSPKKPSSNHELQTAQSQQT